MASIKPKKVSSGRGKQVLTGIFSIGFFCALLGGVYAVYKLDQREVEIVTFKRDVSIGTKITEADIERGTIMKTEYDSKSSVSYVANDGTQQKGQIYIKYSDVESILGQYVTNARRLGDAVTERDISTEEIEPNPWYSQIPYDNELYTMKFDSSDVYTRMLMPGATTRMRIITKVDVEDADEYRKQIQSKSAANQAGLENDQNGYISAILPFYSAKKGDGTSSTRTNAEVPIAEIVFENLTILDAMNKDNESIFDIYYSLNNMDSTVREEYIRENAEDLRSKLIPASLIMSLTKDQATSVAEFENVDTTAYKWTVVKKESEDELYQKFMDIGSRINTITINPDEKSK